MKETTMMIFDELTHFYPALGAISDKIEGAYEALRECFSSGGRIYLCGNGGSAADCEHMVGELLKCFRIKRSLSDGFKEVLRSFGEEGETLAEKLERGLPAISLCGHPAFSTAFQNDNTPELVFAQQLGAYGNVGDVLVAFSTSGNSKNCVFAAICAKALGMKVVAFTGCNGGRLRELSDVTVNVPERETFKIQEYHLPVYHAICAMLEEEFFGK